MSQARALKLREYGTTVIAHDLAYHNNTIDVASPTKIRNSNTFMSRVMEIAEHESAKINKKTAHQVHAKSRERLINENPLSAKVLRASYQDSNIFGYKEDGDITVQNSAKKTLAGSKVRTTGTFSSRVFDSMDQHGFIDEASRSPSTTRQERKWQSTVFEGPIVEESRRKKLGREDAGQECLFGRDQLEYQSSNIMSSVSGRKPFIKTFVPVRQQKTAEQRKQEELHGKSIKVYGAGKKGDGSLMAGCADWRNPN
jgi:hypothetical protein